MLNADDRGISAKETKLYIPKEHFNHVLDIWEIRHFSTSI